MHEIDLSHLEGSEREKAEQILRTLHAYGPPDDFSTEGLKIRVYGGLVFLENSEDQLAALNYSSLETYYVCPACGFEGFEEETLEHAENEACRDHLVQIGLITEEPRELTKRERVSKLLAEHEVGDPEELSEVILGICGERYMELHVETFREAMECIRQGVHYLETHADEVEEEYGCPVFPDMILGQKSTVKAVANSILRACDALE
jgi:hypothetical protein